MSSPLLKRYSVPILAHCKQSSPVDCARFFVGSQHIPAKVKMCISLVNREKLQRPKSDIIRY